MKVERHEKWEPVEGIVTPAARALIEEDHEGLVVTMVFSEIVDGLHSDLRVKFGRVPGHTVYEEFVHPSNGSQTESPKLVGKWEAYTYPLLVIQDSEWVHSLSDRLISFPASVHYRFVTLDQIVDILCDKLPEATWVKPADL
jgi:hypothetical protein